jgi:hypothetical protein
VAYRAASQARGEQRKRGLQEDDAVRPGDPRRGAAGVRKDRHGTYSVGLPVTELIVNPGAGLVQRLMTMASMPRPSSTMWPSGAPDAKNGEGWQGARKVDRSDLCAADPEVIPAQGWSPRPGPHHSGSTTG